MAIGSTFKLYVLAELIRQIEDGSRHWEDVVKLDAKAMSLPSGSLQTWPIGSPLTLHTLAVLMISQSDNTAADELLMTLGRENIEAMLKPAGNDHAVLNNPFLTTLEMFKLHGNTALGDEFIAANETDRRKMLETKVAAASVASSDVDPTHPARFEQLEWFASAADLCRAMDYLRRHTENGNMAEARKILSINPGLQIDASQFPLICFKGGSEPGVLNLTYLLKSRTSAWYALSITANNPQKEIDQNKVCQTFLQACRLLP